MAGQVANVAQLAGVDAYGLIKMIVEAVQTVRRNKETCQKLARRVEMIGDLLQQLQEAQLMQHRDTRNPVEQLEETLRRAFMLITTCQDSSFMYHCFTAGNQAYQFREVENDIVFYLQLFPIVGYVDTTRTWVRQLNRDQPSHTEEPAEEAQILKGHSGHAPRLEGTAETVEPRLWGVNKTSTDKKEQLSRSNIFYESRKRNVKGHVVNKDIIVKLFCAERRSRLLLFNFSQVVEFTENFKWTNVAGRGAFGYVYKGKLPNGIEIAVKRFVASSPQGSEEFTAEIETIGNLQHKNVIRLLGFCIQREKDFLGFHIQGEEMILIYEYMPNKSLASFLYSYTKTGETLNWSKRHHIIEGIAQGLVYLHEHSHQCVVHMDLKASNVLLDYEMNPKISDFGMARILASSRTEGTSDIVKGTNGYIDPEYIRSGKFSVKSDVYSFGIMILEIISRKRCMSLLSNGEWMDLPTCMSESDEYDIEILPVPVAGSFNVGSDEAVGPNQVMSTGKKQMSSRSEIWSHFTRLEDDRNKAKCNYCSRVLKCDSQKNGTSSLVSHAKCCKMHPDRSKNQTQLSYQRSADGSSCVVPWQYNAEEVRVAFTRMIIIDELPFIFPEKEGFKDFISKACPRFKVPSRITMYRDVLRLYEDEKAKLKKYFKDSHQTVSLTTDTWTSSTLQNYMVLTAHYIDSNWQLIKKIISFCLVDSHKGEDIGKALDKCLLEWGIENVCTITVDNASSNDGAIGYMRSSLSNRGATFAKGRHLHMRCVAHIMNLVVQDGLKTMAPSISRIRSAIKYVRSSPARMNNFKKCVQISKVEGKGLVSLDVCTRWNSTYLMLESAVGFEKAFERLELQDPSYKTELVVNGVPKHNDWLFANEFKVFLKHFFDLTEKVSGTKYVTSNTFFEDIAGVNYLLFNLSQREDDDDDPDIFKHMAVDMKKKYDKYWGDPEKMNDFIFIAAMLDPRTKQSDYLHDIINSTYGQIKGEKIWVKALKAFLDLFKEYKNLYSQVGNQCDGQASSQSQTSGSGTEHSKSDSTNIMRSLYNKRMKVSSGGKSELDKYLAEDTEDDVKGFDILTWWKCSSPRFPIISRMASDILAIPISTVASESAFSTSGRVLDDFRSSLSPLTLQCLICAQDWLRGSKRINVEADLADLSKFEGIGEMVQDDDVEDIPTASVFSSDFNI